MTNMTTHDINEIKRRMQGASAVLKTELSGLRTGRASAHLLDPVMVDAYGGQMPLNQVATVSVPEPRLISVNVWDRSLVHPVEKAIVNSNLGFHRRRKARRSACAFLSSTRSAARSWGSWRTNTPKRRGVAVRHVRRDAMDVIKKLEKDHKISKDDHERFLLKFRRRPTPALRKSIICWLERKRRSSQSEVALHAEAEIHPDATAFDMPRHVAIIMDGNGRWRRHVDCLAPKVTVAVWKRFDAPCALPVKWESRSSPFFRSARKTGHARQVKSAN